MPIADAMIAAIARTHGAGLATRNLADFDGSGLELISPWADRRSPALDFLPRALFPTSLDLAGTAARARVLG